MHICLLESLNNLIFQWGVYTTTSTGNQTITYTRAVTNAWCILISSSGNLSEHLNIVDTITTTTFRTYAGKNHILRWMCIGS